MRLFIFTKAQFLTLRGIDAQFINHNIFPRLAFDTIQTRRSKGGLGIIDPVKQQNVLQWRWVRLLLVSDQSPPGSSMVYYSAAEGSVAKEIIAAEIVADEVVADEVIANEVVVDEVAIVEDVAAENLMKEVFKVNNVFEDTTLITIRYSANLCLQNTIEVYEDERIMKLEVVSETELGDIEDFKDLDDEQ
ncbi:hypothetical protein INT48_001177 [Thamnidium elegans]|uniref:Uncharacterized protein n=1 Tax=Thamnidium elegans TaxID=101142 RepID=A0A8H7VRM5_9FUNG|nr:hypothetical protein INT48_001177 [Thamnidium elegans]